MTTRSSTVTVGDRVKILEYNKSTKNKYVGLEGLITHAEERRGQMMFLVLLDDDPAPRLQQMLGGLPCIESELEKL